MNAETLSLVASGVFLVRLLPQPVRLFRSGVADGVSPLSALNAVLAAVAWLVYGFQAHLPVVWVVSLLALVPGVWQAALLTGKVRRSDLVGAGIWALVLVVAGLTGLFGAALGLGVAVTSGPQVLEAVRERDLAGISPATWGISILDASLWGAYGIAIGDGALMGYGVVLNACAVVVLARVAWTRAYADAGLDAVEIDAAVA